MHLCRQEPDLTPDQIGFELRKASTVMADVQMPGFQSLALGVSGVIGSFASGQYVTILNAMREGDRHLLPEGLDFNGAKEKLWEHTDLA